MIVALIVGEALGAPLTLEDARLEARGLGPDSAAFDADVRGAERERAGAGLYFASDPRVSAGTSLSLADGEGGASRAGLDLPLDLTGAWLARGDSARSRVAGAEFARQVQLAALDEAVAIAVADLADAERSVGRAALAASLMETALSAQEARKATGDATALDVDSAALDFAGARAQRARALGDREAARARLARLLGRATGDDLEVADPDEPTTVSTGALDALVERHPRVRAARSGVDRERAARVVARRGWMDPTLSVDLERARFEVPAGSFPRSPSLTGAWTDTEIGATLSASLPLFDREAEARGRAEAATWAAEAQLVVVRADVRAELQAAKARWEAAASALAAWSGTPAVLDRDAALLDQALATGEIGTTERVVMVRRLVDTGRAYDGSVRDLRLARAAWERASAP